MKKFLVIPSLCALLLSAGLAEQAAFAAENVPAQEKQQVMLPPDGKMPPLAQKAGLDISKVIDLKTPKNSWSDVAAKLGVSEADCQAMKHKISKDFGRHA